MNLTTKDTVLAAAVIFLWGINFIFIKYALADLSPMVLGMARFVLMIFPAIFFIKRPNVPALLLFLYGATISFGQFGLTFIAVDMGLATGLVAILVQSQVFFTILLSALLYKEGIAKHQRLALVLSVAGLLLIGIGQAKGVPLMAAVWAAIGAGLSWAMGNLIVKKLGAINPLSLVIWGNLSALALFTITSLVLYGADGIAHEISNISTKGIIGVAFLVYVAGLFGYAGWGSLLSRYPSAKITPLALCLPVISLIVGAIVLHERLNFYHLSGAAVVMIALVVQVFGGRWLQGR
ncbi:hypothetical protein B0181_11375 [Moraxella caviae]|uniref:Probable amino-acid metabolite efflux pump n=1 Tax=Moraxella caviae TaxID=34060 RepID=A0A1S9ZU29_9GAMM|nr:EamA family transporter [Moraxella caviae]OOR87016.1 hypothetical protein B0181_11375 [Moraxella caviae]STZ10026.1 Probable amino-acid metabolite efflux pump [Moraxella caviae]VEW13217.1 Probable amino-acid metabolite efflux pump [Moraxella caviae]